jgi:hypothetical protein
MSAPPHAFMAWTGQILKRNMGVQMLNDLQYQNPLLYLYTICH